MYETSGRVAIVDCRMGNLFSVRLACESAGLDAVITSDAAVIRSANGIILPGVGAFGDAMASLTDSGLATVLKECVARGTPLMGICLGIQLLMTESHEFGVHRGLGLIEGGVERLREGEEGGRRAKVPHVGWNTIQPPEGAGPETWEDSLLADNRPGDFMYFVHSYAAHPVRPEVVLAVTHYGGQTFCAAMRHASVFACQFHPERSGRRGLSVYRRFAQEVRGVSAGDRA
jgi:glutamine amidotransferase